MKAEVKVKDNIESLQLTLLFKNLRDLITAQEKEVIVSSFSDILFPDIPGLERKQTEKKIKGTRGIEDMKETLWKIRHQIVGDSELAASCILLDSQIENYPKKVFVQFVQAEVLSLIFQTRKNER